MSVPHASGSAPAHRRGWLEFSLAACETGEPERGATLYTPERPLSNKFGNSFSTCVLQYFPSDGEGV